MLFAVGAQLGTSVATAAADSCANAQFRTGPGANLPDCRAYERVSPAEKNGAATEGFPSYLTASEDGSAATFYSQAATEIPATRGGTQDYTTFLSSRAGEEWSTQRLLPPQAIGGTAAFLGTTPDLRFAFVEAAQKPGYITSDGLYMIDTVDGSLETIVPSSPNRTSNVGGFYIDGASTDGSRVLFETRLPLDPAATPETVNLYAWSRATGEVELAGVLPNGAAPAGGSFGGAYFWFGGGGLETDLSQGGASSGNVVSFAHAVSPSGDQIYFTTAGNGQLYLRRGLFGSNPETVRISAANPGVVDPNGDRPAAFQEATPDGSKVFFLSSASLTSDANTGASDAGSDLYMWDASTEELTDISPDETDELGAQVQGMLGASDDGSSGYFVAKGVLADGAVAGEQNLYRFDLTASPKVTLVAVLGEGARELRNYSPRSWLGQTLDSETFIGRKSRVTPSGDTLLFLTRRELSSQSGEGLKYYRFSLTPGTADSGHLDCVSCNPLTPGVEDIPGLQSSLVNGGTALPRGNPIITYGANLSNDGDRVFFETTGALLPADTNGLFECESFNNAGGSGGESPRACQDVYEWEAVGTPGGSCMLPEVNGGCLYLLSTGTSPYPSFFAGASSDGTSAFIVTASQLVPTDHDNANDVYDIRVGGGLASQQILPPAPCVGEAACQAAAPPPPGSASPGSASFNGPGNAKPQRKKRKHHKKKRRHHKKQSKSRTAKSNQGGGK
jgi:hypothetical protein